MGTHWAKQQAKRDELRDSLESSLLWVQNNRRTAGMAAGSALLAVLVAAVAYYSRKASQEAAWNEMTLARAYAYNGRMDDTIKTVDDLASHYPASRAAFFSRLLAGDVLFAQGKYPAANQDYVQAVENSQNLPAAPFALSDKVMGEEASGQFDQAVKDAQTFLGTYPDSFLAPMVHTALARSLDALGRKDEAQIAYQKIALQYAGNFRWDLLAKERVPSSAK